MNITIEKNIPIPEVFRANRDSEKYNFLEHLEVGDSFVISHSTPNFVPESARRYIYTLQTKRDTSRKYTIRTLSGKSENPRAIRVWRIR